MARALFVFSALLLTVLVCQHCLAQTQLQCIKSTGCMCVTTNFTIDFSSVFKKTMNFTSEDGKYVFELSPCEPIPCAAGESEPTAALCQYDVGQQVSSNCGQVTEHEWIISTEDSFTVSYAGGDPADKGRVRQAAIQFSVDAEAKVSEISYNDEKEEKNAIIYEFQGKLTYKDAHGKSSSGGGGVAAGVIGIVILFLAPIAFVAYFVIGMIVMYTAKGARGAEMIPNYEFWKGLPILLKDGLCFTISPCKYCFEKRRGTYKSIN